MTRTGRHPRATRTAMLPIMSLALIHCAGVTTSGAPGVSGSEAAASPAETSQLDAPWRYRMKGNLDESELECEGTATMEAIPRADGSRCWAWQLEDVRCTGDRDVDWLHANTDRGEICSSGDSWALTSPSLPGKGLCVVADVAGTAKVLQGFKLECSWECRDPRFPCAGLANYQFRGP